MSDNHTARFALPLLQPGQAQKEMFHNEALARLDLALHAGVVAAGLDTPPATPAEGQCWIVGYDPTGAWAGHAGVLAGWSAGGWRFVAATDGMSAWVAETGLIGRVRDGDWVYGELSGSALTIGGSQVVGPREAAIDDPAGGAVVDGESRAALIAVLGALRTHGLIEN